MLALVAEVEDAGPSDNKNTGLREQTSLLTNTTVSSARSARASHRRLLANSSLNALDPDNLSVRSPSLLFRRSSIHGWGVFAAETIKAGQYITEYRGEIIRPAVADLREVLYEKLKVR